jgi:hypothetical protein
MLFSGVFLCSLDKPLVAWGTPEQFRESARQVLEELAAVTALDLGTPDCLKIFKGAR